MSYFILPALLFLGADAVVQAMGRRSLIERVLRDKYSNACLRLPLVALYAGLLVFVMMSDDFQSWPSAVAP